MSKVKGEIKIEMHFLPDIMVKWYFANGDRYNTQTLEILYRGKKYIRSSKYECRWAFKFC